MKPFGRKVHILKNCCLLPCSHLYRKIQAGESWYFHNLVLVSKWKFIAGNSVCGEQVYWMTNGRKIAEVTVSGSEHVWKSAERR